MIISDVIQQWFFRRIKPQTGTITLEGRTIYVLPTRYGVFFSVVLFIMLLGSINYSNNMGFLLTFLLVGLAFASMLQTYHNLSSLQITIGRTSSVFNGELAKFQIILSSRDQNPAYAIQMYTSKDEMHAVINDVSTTNENLQQSFFLPVQTIKRGIMSLGKIRLWTKYPLGLFHVWSWIEPKASILVYPKPSGLKIEPPHAAFNAGDSKPNGLGNDDYAGMRNYHAGDPPSQIAWKILARNDTLMTKQFTGLADDEVWLDWYTLDKLDTEDRLSQLCQWVLDMHQSRRHYGLRLPNNIIQPTHGEAHKLYCLNALALFKQ